MRNCTMRVLRVMRLMRGCGMGHFLDSGVVREPAAVVECEVYKGSGS